MFVLLVIVAIAQLTILSSFFHPFQTQGVADGSTIVEVSKLEYVFGWVRFGIQGASPQYPVALQFQNGTRVNLTSDYSFQMKLPRSGDCYCSAATGLYGTGQSIDQANPIEAAVVANVSSFDIQIIPNGAAPYGGLFNLYWFVVTGDAIVSVNGYGVSL